jgi:hypothetical protein
VLTADVERGREFLKRHVGRITLTAKSDSPRPLYRASGRLFFSAIDPMRIPAIVNAEFGAS